MERGAAQVRGHPQGLAEGEDADAFLARCRDSYGLSIGGLMCIPPADEAPAPHFALTAKIAARNGLKLLRPDQLTLEPL